MSADDWPVVEGQRTASFLLLGRLSAICRGPCPAHLSFREDQTLRHLAEVLGIPACELGEARADGSPWPLELPPPDASIVELRPCKEPVALSEIPSFLVDNHLGRLSRLLRLLGFDVQARGRLDEDEAIETSIAEGRILLTRNRQFLFRRDLALRRDRAMFILHSDPFEQLVELCRRYALSALFSPLSRCASCGERLESASKVEVLPRLPPIVAERYEEFFSCGGCGKVYWRGDHARSIAPLLERLGAALSSGAGRSQG
jgi:uncharacterized protein